MDLSLKNDIDRFFSVFRNNVEEDLHQTFKPSPAALIFQAAFEEELGEFRNAVLARLKRDSLI